MTTYGFFEFHPNAGKSRAFADHSFPSIQAALDFLGDKVVHAEIDGDCADVFTRTGMIYSVEVAQ